MNEVINNKYSFSEEEQRIYIQDFFNDKNFIDCLSDNFEYLKEIFGEIGALFDLRVYFSKENDVVRGGSKDISYIVKDNVKYLTELKEQVLEIKSREHITFIDRKLISELDGIIKSFDNNIMQGYIYYPENRTRFENNRMIILNSLFQTLNGNGLSLGTKSISKSDTNYNIAVGLYSILCDKSSKKEYMSYFESKISKEKLSKNIKRVVSRLNSLELEKLYEICVNDMISYETLLLCFIITYKINSFDVDIIKDYMNEENLENIEYNAVLSGEEVVDNMSLRKRIGGTEYD